MNAVLQPDLCIIGGGASGLALAAGASSRGLSVALVEKGEIGGDRLDNAIPYYALLAASRFAANLRAGKRFGIEVDAPRIDFAHVREHIAATAAALAPNYSRARLEAMNVQVIRARGRFTRADTLDAGGTTIQARHFTVATGAAAKPLAIPGLELIRPLTFESIRGLDRLPERLIVIGGDPQGLALAQALRRLGGDIVLLSPTRLLATEDDELVAPVREALARDGVIMHEYAKVHELEPQDDGVCAVVSHGKSDTEIFKETIKGSHVLIAAGKAPLVEGLGLAAAGVRYAAAGVEVDADLRTRNRRIFAIGGVVRGARSAEAGEYHARIVLRHLLRPQFGLPFRPMREGAIAKVISTDPEIAVTGLSEAEARERRRNFRILRWPFSETDGVRVARAPAGHVKLITAPGGRILGAGIVGPAAGELINLCTLAISKGMTAADLASIMIPYPTLADAARQAAQTAGAGGGNVAAPLILRLLRRLG
jgi:pyruvate/2-oxoglutarate dehydrogenase complex dihydrolipoamide dehydrogenase (E3) component